MLQHDQSEYDCHTSTYSAMSDTREMITLEKLKLIQFYNQETSTY